MPLKIPRRVAIGDIGRADTVEKLRHEVWMERERSNNIIAYIGTRLWNVFSIPAHEMQTASSTAPPGMENSASSYPGTYLFDGTTLEWLGGVMQVPFSWREGSEIYPRILTARTSSSSNPTVWRLYTRRAIFPGGSFEPWALTAGTLETDPDPGGPDLPMIYTFGSLDMTGYTIGTTIAWQLHRVPTDAGDTYTADMRLFSLDFLYERDFDGAVTRGSK